MEGPVRTGEVEAVRVLIATPHDLDARRLGDILSGAAGFDVVDHAHDGASAVGLAELLRPDLILLDTELPLLNAVEATPVLRRKVPQATIVVLTPIDSGAGGRLAMRLGAHGHLCRSSGASVLLGLVRAALPLSLRGRSARTGGALASEPDGDDEEVSA
ncbi:MAG TPA: response regulator [Candidatus Dormibacteraeota bacterium]|jgi:two-component system nitrate/nitrite response regulator NarL